MKELKDKIYAFIRESNKIIANTEIAQIHGMQKDEATRVLDSMLYEYEGFTRYPNLSDERTGYSVIVPKRV